MEAAVAARPERRQAPRQRHREEHGIVEVRVRPGHQARLIDISSGGALVDTEHRLCPGTAVDIFLDRHRYRAHVRGHVLRCAIVRLQRTSICYRGAIAFDRHLPWFVDSEQVDLTQQVL